MEDALAQQVELGAAVHATLDQLEAVDLPLDRSVAPGLAHGRAHGCLILPEPDGKGAELGCGDGVEPGIQPGGALLAQQLGKGAHVRGGPQSGRGGAERFGEAAILG